MSAKSKKAATHKCQGCQSGGVLRPGELDEYVAAIDTGDDDRNVPVEDLPGRLYEVGRLGREGIGGDHIHVGATSGAWSRPSQRLHPLCVPGATRRSTERVHSRRGERVRSIGGSSSGRSSCHSRP